MWNPARASRNNKMIIPCTVVGDCKTGKSWMTMAFAQRCFPACLKYSETVLDPRFGNIAVSERQYTVKVFDTTGQHDRGDVREMCYKESEVIVICFSVVSRTSFNNVKDFWVPEIKNLLGKHYKPIILVGCQTELRHYGSKKYKNRITHDEGKTLAKHCGLDFYVECSAMSLMGVRDVFENVAWSAIKTRAGQVNFMKRIRRLKSLFSCVTSPTLR